MCFCSFVLYNLAFNGVYISVQRETQPVSESGGESDSSDHNTCDHEDDMTAPDKILPYVLTGLASRTRLAYLSTIPRSVIPLLPPPKS